MFIFLDFAIILFHGPKQNSLAQERDNSMLCVGNIQSKAINK